MLPPVLTIYSTTILSDTSATMPHLAESKQMPHKHTNDIIYTTDKTSNSERQG